ncbi:MAG: hypothetical protein E6L09_03120 [Verrucomicrobia bacterium]|nr:MAG: hypothetical protein E6L09_03120 [Verrucomicrobiota bacterium]
MQLAIADLQKQNPKVQAFPISNSQLPPAKSPPWSVEFRASFVFAACCLKLFWNLELGFWSFHPIPVRIWRAIGRMEAMKSTTFGKSKDRLAA